MRGQKGHHPRNTKRFRQNPTNLLAFIPPDFLNQFNAFILGKLHVIAYRTRAAWSCCMAFKVSKGEALVKAILVRKALDLGAICIIGTDIDYGTTTNNAATVNMQGAAVLVPDLAAILGGRAHEMTVWILWAWSRVQSLSRWLRGDIQPGDTLATE